MRESQVDRNAPRFFFRQAIGIRPGQGADERALAVVDMTRCRENEMSHAAEALISHLRAR